MRPGLLFLLAGLPGIGAAQTPSAPAAPPVPAAKDLSQITRVYVGELVGAQASVLRELLIASLEESRLFVLTENIDRADAVLKGAADDQMFVDTFDSEQSINGRQNAGKYNSGTSSASRLGGGYAGIAVGESEAHHIKEHKHQAYASVRLCNKDGDVLWSTTQESNGAKFRSAGADVAAKVARQLSLDLARLRTGANPPGPSAAR